MKAQLMLENCSKRFSPTEDWRAEVLLRDSEALRTTISSILEREDFFTVGADLRNRLQNLNILVKTNAELLTSQFTQALNQERNDIRSTPLWATLPEADRANFSEKLTLWIWHGFRSRRHAQPREP